MTHITKLLLPALALAFAVTSSAAPAAKPLKALLVIGGCCHDYATQKEILKSGIEARANVQVEVCYSPDSNTKPEFSCYKADNWADGYDVIIHNECAADTKDLAIVNRILEPHRKGLPGVNLHCAMHSFRVSPEYKKPQAKGTEGALWFDYLGLQSTSHGKQMPILVTFATPAGPITKGLEDWTTVNEELYNNVSILDSATTLARGKQGDTETVVAWTNSYGDKKTRVFSTTLGHNNETVADGRYLDLVTRGLLWACQKLDEEGKPLTGFGPTK